MTRINTNVSSLVGRNNLSRANEGLNTALTRLSTGLRINTGADDPAGLIASEKLRSDITSIEAAIGNTERANQVIATADSALSEVSSLLNDIRGLVTESANSGALSEDQLNANQLQIDSSLEAINRIAQTTTFQGNNLLDGSLDFTTTAGTNFAQISDLSIDQANLGTTGSISLTVAVDTAATQAQVDITDINEVADAQAGINSGNVTAAVNQAAGTLTLAGETIDLTAVAGQNAAGAEGNDVANLAITFGAGAAATSYTAGTDTLNVSVTQASATADIDDIIAAINGTGTQFTAALATGSTGSTTVATGDDAAAAFALTGGQDAVAADALTITTADNTPAFNSSTVTIAADSGVAANTAVAAYNSTTDTFEVTYNGEVTLAAVATAIQGLDEVATAAFATGTGVLNSDADNADATAVVNTQAGVRAGLAEDLVFELSGATGSEVFNVQGGTTLGELVSQINLVSDATGVEATDNSGTLELTSTAYGSDAFVDVRVISEGTGSTPSGDFTTAIGSNARNVGADIVATINGTQANGDGNSLSINTSTLDLNLSLAAGFTGNVAFDITGGGALFQLGPDVVSNQQARLGITSVNTARLGSESGGLYELQSGGTADLASDPTTAAAIVNEAIDQITSLRGRLGAFQATTLDSNRSALNSTLTNLSEAESLIRDADFAAETANLTRSQILVQSGTQVLAIANQNPQNVLALLG